MFIQTLETPNPNTLKFVPGRPVFTEHMKGHPETFTKDADLSISPFSKKLLFIEGIEKVFFWGRFYSLNKK